MQEYSQAQQLLKLAALRRVGHSEAQTYYAFGPIEGVALFSSVAHASYRAPSTSLSAMGAYCRISRPVPQIQEIVLDDFDASLDVQSPDALTKKAENPFLLQSKAEQDEGFQRKMEEVDVPLDLVSELPSTHATSLLLNEDEESVEDMIARLKRHSAELQLRYPPPDETSPPESKPKIDVLEKIEELTDEKLHWDEDISGGEDTSGGEDISPIHSDQGRFSEDMLQTSTTSLQEGSWNLSFEIDPSNESDSVVTGPEIPSSLPVPSPSHLLSQQSSQDVLPLLPYFSSRLNALTSVDALPFFSGDNTKWTPLPPPCSPIDHELFSPKSNEDTPTFVDFVDGGEMDFTILAPPSSPVDHDLLSPTLNEYASTSVHDLELCDDGEKELTNLTPPCSPIDHAHLYLKFYDYTHLETKNEVHLSISELDTSELDIHFPALPTLPKRFETDDTSPLEFSAYLMSILDGTAAKIALEEEDAEDGIFSAPHSQIDLSHSSIAANEEEKTNFGQTLGASSPMETDQISTTFSVSQFVSVAPQSLDERYLQDCYPLLLRNKSQDHATSDTPSATFLDTSDRWKSAAQLKLPNLFDVNTFEKSLAFSESLQMDEVDTTPDLLDVTQSDVDEARLAFRASCVEAIEFLQALLDETKEEGEVRSALSIPSSRPSQALKPCTEPQLPNEKAAFVSEDEPVIASWDAPVDLNIPTFSCQSFPSLDFTFEHLPNRFYAENSLGSAATGRWFFLPMILVLLQLFLLLGQVPFLYPRSTLDRLGVGQSQGMMQIVLRLSFQMLILFQLLLCVMRLVQVTRTMFSNIPIFKDLLKHQES